MLRTSLLRATAPATKALKTTDFLHRLLPVNGNFDRFGCSINMPRLIRWGFTPNRQLLWARQSRTRESCKDTKRMRGQLHEARKSTEILPKSVQCLENQLPLDRLAPQSTYLMAICIITRANTNMDNNIIITRKIKLHRSTV